MGNAREEIELLRAVVRRRRRHQIVGLVLVVAFAFLALIARLSGTELLGLSFAFWGPLAALVLLGKIVFLLLSWRCPNCNAPLGPTYNPHFCSGCGVSFRSSEGR